MKSFKRTISLMLVAIMAVMACGATTAFAAEVDPANDSNVVATEVETASARSTTIVNDTFNMYGPTHRGADRTYRYNKLGFTCRITDTNGNPLPSNSVVLEIRLIDNVTGATRAWQIGTDSGLIVLPVSITNGRSYHFEYIFAYGNPPIQVHMIINGDN